MPGIVPADRAAGRPSPEMRLLLVAAAAADDQARAAWASWLRAVDIEELEDGATALLSLVSTNVGDLRADPAIVGRVRGVHRQTWARNQLLWAAGAPLVDRLGAAVGAPPLLLPPTALLPIHDGDWGARPLERIQVALPTTAVGDARAALTATGWEVAHITPSLVARTTVGLVERWQAQDRAGNWVSIRWHVLRGVRSAVADEQLRGAATATTVGASSVHLLHPADALVERIWNSAGDTTPGWIADVVRLARRLADGTTARTEAVQRFTTRAHDLGLQPALRDRLELVAATVPDPAVLAVLDPLRATRPGLTAALWTLPGPAARRGRVWAGHAAGQGVVGGARSLGRAKWASRQLRSRGSAQRR